MSNARRLTAVSAGILGFTGVALGAFGAHGLKETLAAHGTQQLWDKAVLYHLVHAVALVAVAGGSSAGPRIRWAARCWTAGVILFSGSLYVLSLGGPKILGLAITPLGGVAFLAGWLFLIGNAFQSPSQA